LPFALRLLSRRGSAARPRWNELSKAGEAAAAEQQNAGLVGAVSRAVTTGEARVSTAEREGSTYALCVEGRRNHPRDGFRGTIDQPDGQIAGPGVPQGDP